MPLSNLPIHSLLHPNYLIHKLIPPLPYHLTRDAVLSINNPNKDEAVCLQALDWHVSDIDIAKGIVSNCYTSRRLRGGKLPRRIHHNDIKELSIRLLLFGVNQFLPLEVPDIGAYWYGHVRDGAPPISV